MEEQPDLGIDHVRAFLKQKGIDHEIVELTASARTAQLAAEAIGTSLAQIVKSLIFKGSKSDSAVLVLTSGANRVDEKKVALLIGEPFKKAHPDFVHAHTGFIVGAVPPFAHREPMRTLIDEDLLAFPFIWAAAGHEDALIRLLPRELLAISNAQAADVKSAHRPLDRQPGQ
jgi:Cys-tRNA(Pro) deacylase